MFVEEHFLTEIVDEYGQHPISTDIVFDIYHNYAGF